MTSTTMTQVESLQTENNRLVELQQVLINQIAFYDDGDLIEMYLERIGFRHEHHDAYRIFGKPHYLQYIKDRFERENTDMRYLNLFQVICRKWLVRRDLSPDIFEADTEEEEEYHFCGETGGEHDDIECCHKKVLVGYTCVIENTSYCIDCFKKYEPLQHWTDEDDKKLKIWGVESRTNRMTVKQLKQYCRDNQIVGYSKLKKAELKQLIIKTPH